MSDERVSILDRREFMARAGMATAVVCLPVALGTVAPQVGAVGPRAVLADWTVDDMWGVFPRPSEAIGYGRPRGDGERVAAVPPADWQYVA